jgi:transcriptional regulator with XRE-family HTH domain
MYTATRTEGTPSRGPRLLRKETLLGVLPGPGDEPISATATHAKIVSTGLEIDLDRVNTMLYAKANSGLVERVKAGRFCSWRKTEAGMSAPKRSAHARQDNEPKTRMERQRSVFAANLRRRIKELNLNQSDVARAVWRETHLGSNGYGHPKGKDQISDYCKGATMPRDATLVKIAEILKTTPEALLGGSNSVSVPTPKTINEREHFAFAWDGGASVMVDLKATFPEAAGREIAALITKHLKSNEGRAAANGAA